MSTTAHTKRIVIIAGPNGAGKTTFAREFLPTDAELPNFVNADLIAAGLSPFAPDLAAFKAGRIMLETIADYARRGESFSFETTLSGLSYAQMIPVWRSSGYLVKLIFLSLPNIEIALERVATRVIQGGHNVPEVVIRRRFVHGIQNFDRYKVLVDSWQLYDNSDAPPVLLDESLYHESTCLALERPRPAKSPAGIDARFRKSASTGRTNRHHVCCAQICCD